MASGTDVSVRAQINSELSQALETLSRLVESFVNKDEGLFRIQASSSWANLDKVSTEIHGQQLSNEEMRQVLAVYMKWSRDETVAVKTRIATLQAFVKISSDEQTEMGQQEVAYAQLLEDFKKHLMEADKELRKKVSQDYRVVRLVTNALANSSVEARKARGVMEKFTSDQVNRQQETVEKKLETEASIREAECNHEKLVEQLMEADQELNLLRQCYQTQQHQGQELRQITLLLDPITICCNTLVEASQTHSVDPLVIMPILGELSGFLGMCFTKQALDLYTIQGQRENIETLQATVESLRKSQASLELNFEHDTFTEDQFDAYIPSLGDHTSFSDHPYSGDRQSSTGQRYNVDDLAGDMGASREGNSSRDDNEAIVVPGQIRMRNIETYIGSMLKLSSSDDADFSLQEFEPLRGFQRLHWPTSFQASIIQLESTWSYYLMASRNAFLAFQLYTRLMCVCLIQADQAIKMLSIGKPDDVERYVSISGPLLENICTKIARIARQSETNLDELTGILAELTETCTAASGKAGTRGRELTVKGRVNVSLSNMTDDEIEKLRLQRETLLAGIRKAEQEFAQVVLQLPGAFSMMTYTAADRCTAALGKASRFFRNMSQKVLNLDIGGFFRTGWREIKNIGVSLGETLTAPVTDDCEEATPSFLQENLQAEDTLRDSVAMDTLLRLEVLKLIPAVDTMRQMLLNQGDLNIQRSSDSVWETQAQLDGNMRALNINKKHPQRRDQVNKSKHHKDLEGIVSKLQEICEVVLGESKKWHNTPQTYQKVLSDLKTLGDQLKDMDKELKVKLDEAVETGNEIRAKQMPTTERRGFHVLERIAIQRQSKAKTLQVAFRRYEGATQQLTSLYDTQRETADVLTTLTSELNQLSRTLELLKTASIQLTNLQKDVEVLRSFSEKVTNVVQNTLCPRVTRLLLHINNCLAASRQPRDGISLEKVQSINREIQESGRTAKYVYEASRQFLHNSNGPFTPSDAACRLIGVGP